MARVERDRGELVNARMHIEAALDIVESIRGGVDRSDLRTSYFATARRHYELYIDVLMQLHQRQPTGDFTRAALEASGRSRARTLLETLRESRTDIRAGVDKALLDRERDLRGRLNAKAERLTRILSGTHSEAQAAAGRIELESLLTGYQQVQGEIRAKSPQYAALTQPVPLTVSEIQQQVLDDDTVLLEYILGEERSYLWAVTRQSIVAHALPRRDEIEAKARRVYELMTNSFKPEIAPQAKLEAAALSRMILGPASRDLGSHRLMIVADGALQYVPFGVLPRPDALSAVPLIVTHEVVSLPSASVLAVLRRELAGRQSAPHAVAVLADPVLDRNDPRVARRPVRTAGVATDESDLLRAAAQSGVVSFKRLPFSRQEAEAITGLAAKATTLKALDFDASRATAMSPALGQYRVVHFATHGLINSQHPELSGVVLSLVDPRGDAQDGFLRLNDIYGLKLGADLVVLSACRTALGKSVKGEGLIGLTRGFMYAGAPRILASLWDVRDRATAELMKRFYQGLLRDGLRPAAALRAAQVSMSREPRWQAPYYWAGFVLQGEWK